MSNPWKMRRRRRREKEKKKKKYCFHNKAKLKIDFLNRSKLTIIMWFPVKRGRLSNC